MEILLFLEINQVQVVIRPYRVVSIKVETGEARDSAEKEWSGFR